MLFRSQRDVILAEIASFDSEGVRVAELLSNFPLSDRAGTALIERLSGVRFDDLSDTSAGMAIGKLATMIDTARRLIARAASVQVAGLSSPQMLPANEEQQDDDQDDYDGASTRAAGATPFWPQVQRTQPQAAPASASITMPAPIWPGVARRDESTQTAQSNGESTDWRAAFKDMLADWSERGDVDKDEMVSLLQAFIAELEAKV